jgi:regulator of cell morphogenesis and NO signaling
MTIDISQKVGEVVADDIRAAHVFKKYGIDFCCGGGIAIADACSRNDVNVDNVLDDLAKALNTAPTETVNFDDWSAAELCDYIEEKHHSYVKEALPMLIAYADKVASVHGHHHPELIKMQGLVHALVAELDSHLMKEEKVLFPNIRQAVEDASHAENLPFGQFEHPVQMMEQEHDHAGDVVKELRKISNNYFLPDYACNTWKAYFHLLTEFEDDLFMHIHLENNVLHGKARKMDVV